MRISNSTVKFLAKQYRKVLIKCALINLGLFAVVSNANAYYVYDALLDSNNEYVITDTLTNGSEDVMAVASTAHPKVIISGQIDGTYTGTFSAYKPNQNTYSTIVFQNWNPTQVFNINNYGYFIFEKNNQYGTNANSVILNTVNEDARSNVFLNGNTLSKASANKTMNVHLGGFKNTVESGYTYVLDGYNLANADIITGGLANTVNGNANSTIKNSEFLSVIGSGQGSDINGNITLNVEDSKIFGSVYGNKSEYQDVNGNISTSYVDGDINVTIKNSEVNGYIYGQNVVAYGNEKVGLSGTINVVVEDSNINKDVRGMNISSYDANKGSATWMDNGNLETHDVNITVKNSTVGGEILGIGSRAHADDITINLLGEVNAESVLVGPKREYGKAENVALNFDSDGTINVSNYVDVGTGNDAAIITGNADFNMSGGGSATVGGVRALNIEGKSSLNMTDFSLTSNAEISGFDEVNMDEKSVLTAGTLSATSDSVFNVVLDSEYNYSKIITNTLDVNGATLNFTINNEGVYNLVSYTTNVSDFTWNLDNALYDLFEENGTITVETKSAEDIAQDNGVSAEQADALVSIIGGKNSGNEKAEELANQLNNAMQNGNSDVALNAAKDAAPTTSYVVIGVAKENMDTIANSAFNHLDASNRLWAQGIYNHAKQDATSSNDEYSADSTGLALGADKDISENTTLGLGFAYIETDAESANRDITVQSHNFFVYGKYQPSKWYAKAMFNYGLAQYEEDKNPLGVSLNGKYDLSYYSAQVMGGYELDNGLIPEFGLRYLMVNADSYFDGIQKVSQDKNDVLTAVLGTKYDKEINAELPFKLKANAKLALTYDLMADDYVSTAVVAGGNEYTTTSEKLNRFGVEGSIGLTGSVDNIDVSLEYNGSFRKDYNSNGGMVKVKYNF